jgi:hypothetical protein
MISQSVNELVFLSLDDIKGMNLEIQGKNDEILKNVLKYRGYQHEI